MPFAFSVSLATIGVCVFSALTSVAALFILGGLLMTREELKAQIDELMRQYAVGEIDSATYASKMMELTSLAQNDTNEN